MKSRIESLQCSKSRFEVDATYVIHYADANRMAAMKEQLTQYNPTGTVHFFIVTESTPNAECYV